HQEDGALPGTRIDGARVGLEALRAVAEGPVRRDRIPVGVGRVIDEGHREWRRAAGGAGAEVRPRRPVPLQDDGRAGDRRPDGRGRRGGRRRDGRRRAGGGWARRGGGRRGGRGGGRRGGGPRGGG